MISLYLSLGSNLGDRKANIREALRLLDESFGVGYESLSDLIETESWGFEADKFINCAVLYKLPRTRQSTEDQALDILKTVKAVERRLGRDEVLEFAPDGSRIYHSRSIDIDILFFGPHRILIDTLPECSDAAAAHAVAGPLSAAVSFGDGLHHDDGSCPSAAGPCPAGAPVLQIPHPLITERDFVMIPLAQIAKNSLKREFPSIFKN